MAHPDPTQVVKPFRPLRLSDRERLALDLEGVPQERLPLGHAPIEECPEGTSVGDLVTDAKGRWCQAIVPADQAIFDEDDL